MVAQGFFQVGDRDRRASVEQLLHSRLAAVRVRSLLNGRLLDA